MSNSQKTLPQLPTLLPAPPGVSSWPDVVQSKRRKLSAACQECRARKTKDSKPTQCDVRLQLTVLTV